MLGSKLLRQIQAVLVRVDCDHGRPEKGGKVGHTQPHRSHPEDAHPVAFAHPSYLLKPVMDAGHSVADQSAVLETDIVRQYETGAVRDSRKVGVASILLETDISAVKWTGNGCADLAQLAFPASRCAVNGYAISLSKAGSLPGFHHDPCKFVPRCAGRLFRFPIQRVQVRAAKRAGFDLHNNTVILWNRVRDLLDSCIAVAEKL